MKHLKQLLMQPLKAVPTSLAVFLLIVALLGFADATYLTIEHFQGVIPPCSVLEGCETVLTSVYSVIFGMPASLFGALYYLLILIGVYAYIDTKNSMFLRSALLITIPGFIVSLILMCIMVFVIQAFCLYCFGSAVTSTILFVTALVIFRKYKISNNTSRETIGGQENSAQ